MSELESALNKLTEIQRRAATWGEGALLVLAGPGSGKTQVLTCRIARLLDQSREEKFRVLALTFTNKAADEMKGRVSSFVPDLEQRATISTFHGFCAQVLRQHGVHLGINPNFSIYSTEQDRRAILEEAFARNGKDFEDRDKEPAHFLGMIDQLKSRLISPDSAAEELSRFPDPEHLASVYELYENELKSANALDFNSLILEAHRLFQRYPNIALRYRRTFTFWLVDEFQDTNRAQYRLIRMMAGDAFRNLFVVADDDQIIYQWNGASYRQLQRFRSDFKPSVIQLSTNFRCPPAIVRAANRLVAYNSQRTEAKDALISGKSTLRLPEREHIQLREFQSEEVEAQKIAEEIRERPKAERSLTCVLARNRTLLERVSESLNALGVPATFLQRRDDFLSAHFRWLTASLRQVVRPMDKRNLAVLVESHNRMVSASHSPSQIIAVSEATGQSYLETWAGHVAKSAQEREQVQYAELLKPLISDSNYYQKTAEQIVKSFSARAKNDSDSDLAEDCAAWKEIDREIRRHMGRTVTIDQYLQELQLRSKEPSPKSESVVLMTIHAAKGREFDFVYLIGLGEGILPSFQSVKQGDDSPEMEEERRNCFVAITRAKECLILSRAKSYRGWEKEPSRFLLEMGLLE